MTPATDDAPSGRATESGNAASTAEVRAMFDKIARVYDPMNLVISAFQEPRWRKRAVKLTGAKPGDRILDVATGTGKVAADLQARVQPGGTVLGVDISPAMIRVAQRRFADRPGLTYVVGDALALPTEDGSFDAATIAFGMRNLPDYGKGFAELARSVRPGGRVVCLEIARPQEPGRPGPPVLVRQDRPDRRSRGGPGRRLRLPRPERQGLPRPGPDRRDHARGRPQGRHLGRDVGRDRHHPHGDRPRGASRAFLRSALSPPAFPG